MRLLLPLLVLLTLGCLGGDEQPSPGEVAPPPLPLDVAAPAPAADGWGDLAGATTLQASDEREVHYAAVDVAAAAVPAEFSAPVVLTTADPPEAAGPPRAWMRARLCQGDPEFWTRAEAGLAAAQAAAAPEKVTPLQLSYAELLAWCGNPAMCAQAERRYPTSPAARRRHVRRRRAPHRRDERRPRRARRPGVRALNWGRSRAARSRPGRSVRKRHPTTDRRQA